VSRCFVGIGSLDAIRRHRWKRGGGGIRFLQRLRSRAELLVPLSWRASGVSRMPIVAECAELLVEEWVPVPCSESIQRKGT
jgi:hypothetical protein